jgi:hypothetical protein
MSMDLSESDRNWIAGKFGIDVNEIVTHHSGNCYDRCIVRSMAAAEKVKAAVAGQTINGGYMHGLPLGSITKIDDNRFSVTC